MSGQLRSIRHGESRHVAELVLDRPGSMNALSTAFVMQLRDSLRALTALAESAEVRSVVLSSSGQRAFCVGADLRERNRLTDAELRAQRMVYRSMTAAFRELPVPAVAAVAGYAMGGGFELALLCDLIVVDPTAVFALPEVSVGVVPGLGGTQLLSRRVGLSRASDLIFTARRMDAHEALASGAVDRLVEPGTVREAAIELATTIAANSPIGVRHAKRALRLGYDTDLASGFEIEDSAWRATALSPDRVEGVAAFVEKRRPNWPGTP
jgi:enoyl-CoA hydratase/carnithine racemase